MNPNPLLRRDFLKSTGLTTGALLASTSVPHLFGAEPGGDLKVALVGTGGRGTGAAAQCLAVANAPTKLVAMADVNPSNLNSSHSALSNEYREKEGKVDVPEDRRFVGFDSYKLAMDCLSPGDIVILATPPAFRWVHFAYAIEKGLHVFMEKPVTVDAPTSQRMLELAKKADEKNLKCGVGLMVRHCRGRMELKKRIEAGEIGDILLLRAYRMHGPVASCFSDKKPADENEVLFQIRRFHSFLWASGGLFSDFYIHQIDECCWMKGSWPVKASALGGRHYRGDNIDQNFDVYDVEYTFDDGTKFFFQGRTMNGTHQDMSSVAHGSKGSAVISDAGHTPGKARIYPDQRMKRGTELWRFPQPEPNPYQTEWDDFIEAIVQDKPYNEVPRGVEASLVTSLGRFVAHTGQEVTLDAFRSNPVEFAPGLDRLTQDGPAPVMPDGDGKYPIPQPGIVKDKEY